MGNVEVYTGHTQWTCNAVKCVVPVCSCICISTDKLGMSLYIAVQ